VWRDCLHDLARTGALEASAKTLDIQLIAVEYEFRTNPCWPMPDVLECLSRLRAAGITLGIVSNAQFYTREMFRGLLHEYPEALGFDPAVQFYSYRYRRAKPDPFLYRLAKVALVKKGISAQNILYVGNDMRNDIQPAAYVGFRTALFAGDRRSLRRRSDDERVRGLEPDLVLTSLAALLKRIHASPSPPA
jgi:putative hydrolase of the HAD superfamily